MGILTTLQGRKAYLDTNVFIYALGGYAAFADELTTLFAAVERCEASTVTSELTLAELLV
ncbi:MAG: hypothetical protein HYU36_01975 [Planctomycetes bacterium]|nr:hypothetical protein [Planctomycetota bacterium]